MPLLQQQHPESSSTFSTRGSNSSSIQATKAMDLENLVANRMLVHARRRQELDPSHGRSRRWRRLLAFPLAGECAPLED